MEKVDELKDILTNKKIQIKNAFQKCQNSFKHFKFPCKEHNIDNKKNNNSLLQAIAERNNSIEEVVTNIRERLVIIVADVNCLDFL